MFGRKKGGYIIECNNYEFIHNTIISYDLLYIWKNCYIYTNFKLRKTINNLFNFC